VPTFQRAGKEPTGPVVESSVPPPARDHRFETTASRSRHDLAFGLFKKMPRGRKPTIQDAISSTVFSHRRHDDGLLDFPAENLFSSRGIGTLLTEFLTNPTPDRKMRFEHELRGAIRAYDSSVSSSSCRPVLSEDPIHGGPSTARLPQENQESSGVAEGDRTGRPASRDVSPAEYSYEERAPVRTALCHTMYRLHARDPSVVNQLLDWISADPQLSAYIENIPRLTAGRPHPPAELCLSHMVELMLQQESRTLRRDMGFTWEGPRSVPRNLQTATKTLKALQDTVSETLRREERTAAVRVPAVISDYLTLKVALEREKQDSLSAVATRLASEQARREWDEAVTFAFAIYGNGAVPAHTLGPRHDRHGTRTVGLPSRTLQERRASASVKEFAAPERPIAKTVQEKKQTNDRAAPGNEPVASNKTPSRSVQGIGQRAYHAASSIEPASSERQSARTHEEAGRTAKRAAFADDKGDEDEVSRSRSLAMRARVILNHPNLPCSDTVVQALVAKAREDSGFAELLEHVDGGHGNIIPKPDKLQIFQSKLNKISKRSNDAQEDAGPAAVTAEPEKLLPELWPLRIISSYKRLQEQLDQGSPRQETRSGKSRVKYVGHAKSGTGRDFHDMAYPLNLLPKETWRALHSGEPEKALCSYCLRLYKAPSHQQKLFLVAERLSWPAGSFGMKARGKNEQALWEVNFKLGIEEPVLVASQPTVMGGENSKKNR
jgi:hypothetical protein